jgi:hypothetical protein
MLAILLIIALICFWVLNGLSIFAILRSHTNFYLRLLISPALGMAISVVCLFTLSRLGFSIKAVAFPLFLFGILLAVYFCVFKKITWKRRAFGQLFILGMVAIIPFAWPFLKFGFEWLAFVNGDMSYYSLSSSRFLNYGYAEMPASGNIYDDSDHSLAYWYFPNELGHRSGADLLLAQLVSVTGLTAHQVYMPLISACHVCVTAGAGALALLGSRRWVTALWATALAALSPLLTLEVTMQLLAQAIGLVFLTSLCVSYVKAMLDRGSLVWTGVTVVLFCGLAIAYSELTPFFGLFVLVTEATRWKKWTEAKMRKVYLRTIAVLALGVILVLNSYLIDVAKFVILAMGGSFKSAEMTIQASGLSLFPYFFVPSGGAVLWGWMPLSGQAISPVVVLGLMTTLLFIGGALVASIRGMPSAQMSIVMLAVAVSMYIGGNGFGLFKIAMFIQPFMLATCAMLVTLCLTRQLFHRLGLTLLGLSFIPTQLANITRVSGDVGEARVPYASTARFGEQLRELSSTARLVKNTKVYSDTPLRELFLLESYYFKGVIFSAAALPSTREFLAEKFAKNLSKSNIMKVTDTGVEEREFYFDPALNGKIAKFKVSGNDDLKIATLISSSKEFSPINRFNQPSGRKFYLQSIHDLKNHLVFRQTSLGTSYVGKRGLAEGGVVLWDIEPDPFFIGQTMSSVGRYHLYEVLGSRQESKMLLSLSASMNRQNDFLLPFVNTVGSTVDSLPLVGRGSARVVSSAISPLRIGHLDYIGIDFGRDGSFLESERTGVMGWYGNNIKLDIRKTVAFARDISYIAPDQYAAFKRPQALQSFPAALENPNLEYSGIFEDGWLSDVAYVVLKALNKGEQGVLHLSGLIPDIDGVPFSTTLTIKINDQVVYQGLHSRGNVNISIPFVGANGDNQCVKVQVESSALQRLPHGDDRPVSLLIREMGFVATPKPEKIN